MHLALIRGTRSTRRFPPDPQASTPTSYLLQSRVLRMVVEQEGRPRTVSSLSHSRLLGPGRVGEITPPWREIVRIDVQVSIKGA